MTALAAPVQASLGLRSTARTDVGAVRRLNEDRFVDRPQVGLWAVADGMGGHHDGDAASTLVAQALARLDGYESGYAFLNGVIDALQDANGELLSRAADLPPGGITGTTVVALVIDGGHAACVWAGDSRAYHMSGGQLRRITRDHSLVQELIEAGGLPADEAVLGRAANVITRAVGASATLDLDKAYLPVGGGDRFLLCSDGLTGAVSEDDIQRALGEQDLAMAADALLHLALSRHPVDNVTFVVIEADPGPSKVDANAA